MDIRVEYSESSLWDGTDAPTLAGYDVPASCDRYGELVMDAIHAQYPLADIGVDQTGSDSVEVNFGDPDSMLEQELVEDIVGRVYADYEWLVLCSELDEETV